LDLILKSKIKIIFDKRDAFEQRQSRNIDIVASNLVELAKIMKAICQTIFNVQGDSVVFVFAISNRNTTERIC